MTNSEFELRPYDLTSPRVVVQLAGSALISGFGSLGFLFPNGLNWVGWAVFGALSAVLPVVALHLLSDKIVFSRDGVTRKSLLRSYTIKRSDIRSFGIFRQSRYLYTRTPIQESEVVPDNFGKHLFHEVYLSTNEEFDLRSTFPKRHINMQYRKADFQKIVKWMEG